VSGGGLARKVCGVVRYRAGFTGRWETDRTICAGESLCSRDFVRRLGRRYSVGAVVSGWQFGHQKTLRSRVGSAPRVIDRIVVPQRRQVRRSRP
jgi:hypothetical protein